MEIDLRKNKSNILKKFHEENKKILNAIKKQNVQKNKDYLIVNCVKRQKEINSLMRDILKEIDKKSSRMSPDDRKNKFPIDILFLKAFIIHNNCVELLEKLEVISSAYLVRGLIEIFADINLLIKDKENKYSKEFMEKFEKILIKDWELTHTMVNGDFSSFGKIDEKWIKEIKIEERIKKLGAIPYRSYDRLCYLCHSSPYHIHLVYKKENRQNECISQLSDIFTTTSIGILLLDYTFNLNLKNIQQLISIYKKSNDILFK